MSQAKKALLKVWSNLIESLTIELTGDLKVKDAMEIIKINKGWAIKARINASLCPSKSIRKLVDLNPNIQEIMWDFLSQWDPQKTKQEIMNDDDLSTMVLENLGNMASQLENQESCNQFLEWIKHASKKQLNTPYPTLSEGSIVEDFFYNQKLLPGHIEVVNHWMDQGVSLQKGFKLYIETVHDMKDIRPLEKDLLLSIMSHKNKKYKKEMQKSLNEGTNNDAQQALRSLWESLELKETIQSPQTQRHSKNHAIRL